MKGPSYFAAAGLASFLMISGSHGAVTSSFPLLDAQRAAAAKTNYTDNTVTNLMEVRMSRNHFVNDYRTNWVEHVTTNFFDLYRTNQWVRNLTNSFIVESWRTNSVDLFHTNWEQVTATNEVVINMTRTNVVGSYRTNWQYVTLTNPMVVNGFATNLQTLFLTNWQTVVVMKTNWVTQFVTNVVQLDLPRTVSVAQTAPARAPTRPKTVVTPVAHTAPAVAGSSDDPVIEVSRTAKPPKKGLVEVEMKIRWPADTTDAPPVQQWRIEREGGSFLCFGQEQECRKELPVGNYIVQARLQRDADSPAFVLKGTLSVSIKDAVVQQRTDRSKLAAVP
jgi:hypothetical protein